MTIFKRHEYARWMVTASELIDALGGNGTVAEKAGVKPSAVSNWRKFGCFPPRVYLRLAAHARKRGIEIPEELFRERVETAA